MSNQLFRVTVVLNIQGTMLAYLYTDAKRALEAAEHLGTNDPLASVTIRDDFGSMCQIRRDCIVAVQLAEIGKQMEGEAELAYTHALKQAELQKKAQADVRLKSGILVPGNSQVRPS